MLSLCIFCVIGNGDETNKIIFLTPICSISLEFQEILMNIIIKLPVILKNVCYGSSVKRLSTQLALISFV